MTRSTHSKRRPITAAMKLEVLRRYAKVQCSRCRNDFIPSAEFIQYDHVVPLGLGGRHIWENLQPLCKPCHALKTDGPAHLKVDGDKSKIAKVDRLSIARLAKDQVEQRVGNDPGFRLKKKMDGSVVRVRTR